MGGLFELNQSIDTGLFCCRVINHQHHYRNFKHYYIDHVSVYWANAFPQLPAWRVTRHASYQRFIEWIPQTLMPLCVYLKQCFGAGTGISFIDSTCLKVCWAGDPPSSHNRRISGHKVFKNLAARGKTSVDWFFGFKLHLVANENGELLNITLTPGNIDDRKPVPKLVSSLWLSPLNSVKCSDSYILHSSSIWTFI